MSSRGDLNQERPASSSSTSSSSSSTSTTPTTTTATVTTSSTTTTRTCWSLFVRASLLFAVGVGFAFVLNLLQIQRNVTHFSSDLIDNLFKSAWWVPPSCGTAAAVIGLLHPMFDHLLGESQKHQQEWANVMKIIAVFIGINYASAKIEYSNNLQLSLTLAAMSIGLWWLFDRSRSGFGLGVSIAVLATLVTQLLVYYGVYMYTEPDFLYVRSWLPCVFFSGGVTMGNIGRQLAMYDYRNKKHQD